MLPVPTDWARSSGEASRTPVAAINMNRTNKRRAKLKFKIVDRTFGIFTEPFFRRNLSAYQTCESSSFPYWQTTASEVRLRSVVASPMPHAIRRCLDRAQNRDLNTAKLRVRQALRRIVGQKVLSAEFVADLAEGIVQLRHRGRVVILASRVFRELDQGMFAAGLASCTVLDRHHDNAVDQCFGLFGGARSLLVINFADGVSAVGDQHHHFATLTAVERT